MSSGSTLNEAANSRRDQSCSHRHTTLKDVSNRQHSQRGCHQHNTLKVVSSRQHSQRGCQLEARSIMLPSTQQSLGCVKPAPISTLPITPTQYSQGCVKPCVKTAPLTTRLSNPEEQAFMTHATVLIQGAWRRTINVILFMDEPRSNHISITNRQEVKDHRQLRYPNPVSYIKYFSTGLVTKSPKREFAFIIHRDTFVQIINRPSQTTNMS